MPDMSANDVAEPCRWASAFQDGTDGETQFINLTPQEQVSRGQELLRLLWEPVTPRSAAQPSPATCPQALSLEAKSSFGSSSQDQLQHEVAARRIELSSCIDSGDSQCQKNRDGFFDGPSNAQLQHAWGKHRILDLSACLDEGRREKHLDTLPPLSEASTNTPRDPVEDTSSNDVLSRPTSPHDALLSADVGPDRAMDTPSFEPSLPYTQHCSDSAWQRLPADLGLNSTQQPLQSATQSNLQCMPTQVPFPHHTMNGNAWSPTWQWTTDSCSWSSRMAAPGGPNVMGVNGVATSNSIPLHLAQIN